MSNYFKIIAKIHQFAQWSFEKNLVYIMYKPDF